MANADANQVGDILREIRVELRERRSLLLQLVDSNQRAADRFDIIERRISDLRPHLELMLKREPRRL